MQLSVRGVDIFGEYPVDRGVKGRIVFEEDRRLTSGNSPNALVWVEPSNLEAERIPVVSLCALNIDRQFRDRRPDRCQDSFAFTIGSSGMPHERPRPFDPDDSRVGRPRPGVISRADATIEGMVIRKVLVVDDEADMRTLIRNMLRTDREADFPDRRSRDGNGRPEAADRSGPFDLILLDDDFFRHGRILGVPARSATSACDVPIVFVTARGSLKDYAAGRQAGADSYLVKPFSKTLALGDRPLFTSLRRRLYPWAEP